MRGEITFILVIFLCFGQNLNMAHPIETNDMSNLFLWRRSDDEAIKCEPFTTFTMECNRCVCNADGIAYCTKMACVETMMLRPRHKSTPTLRTKNDNMDFNELSSVEGH